MTPEERFARIEHYLAGSIERHAKDFDVIKAMFREVAERQKATDRQIETIVEMQRVSQERLTALQAEQVAIRKQSERDYSEQRRETDRRLRASGEALDERIGKLVTAIVKLTRTNGENDGAHEQETN